MCSLRHLALAEHHLRGAGGIPQIDEDDTPVIAPARHPPGQPVAVSDRQLLDQLRFDAGRELALCSVT